MGGIKIEGKFRLGKIEKELIFLIGTVLAGRMDAKKFDMNKIYDKSLKTIIPFPEFVSKGMTITEVNGKYLVAYEKFPIEVNFPNVKHSISKRTNDSLNSLKRKHLVSFNKTGRGYCNIKLTKEGCEKYKKIYSYVWPYIRLQTAISADIKEITFGRERKS